MSKKTLTITVLIVILVIFGMIAVFIAKKNIKFAAPVKTGQNKCRGDDASSAKCADIDSNLLKKDKIRKFKSEKEFKEYVANMDESTLRGPVASDAVLMESSVASPLGQSSKSDAERVSKTNVQVLDIDEPDEVKTNGSEIYLSQQDIFGAGLRPLSSMREISPSYFPITEKEREVQIIKAFPLSEFSKIGKIDKSGNLILSEDNLVVFFDRSIYGYNVSNPKSPQELWKIDLKENTWLAGSRLYNGKLYIATRQNIAASHPCPFEPLSVKGVAYPIRCEEIYYPEENVPVDSTFTAMAIDVKSGDIEDSTSIVGSMGNSVVYMSENALYITYAYSGDLVNYTYGFFKEQLDLVPEEIVEKIAKLKEYDISDSSKLNELGIILQKHQNSLGDDEGLKLENEIQNKMGEYSKKHKRELERTGIIKLKIKGLDLAENGNIPGRLLNQFSLDEYQGNLRVAVTAGGGWISSLGSSTESSNDVYVLNSDLKEIGSVQDLGKEERIYSVRFLEDKGYLVTFKQIDPFFVLDLADPKNPQVKGELKIPGYSSYLHPVSQNRILGIGKENNQVKISLFDVSNPSSPIEKSKYTLDEYWSEILNTQHAFLQDKKHEVFFIPGNKGAYIFSYKNDELKLAKAVSETQVKRALYINDYLYLVGDNKIIVLNENNWEKVNELEL